MFKLGLCSVTFREKPVEEIIEIAAQQGLEGIEWGADVHVKPDSPAEYVAVVAGKCRSAGLAVPSYGSYFDVLEHQPVDFTPIVEKAALLGAGVIRVWGGWVRPEVVTDEQFEKITSTSRRIAAMAEEADIRVAFEFHDHTPTEGGDNVLKVLEGAHHPNLYTYYQLIRPNEYDWNLENLEKIYPRLAYVHVQANDGEKNLPLEHFKEVWKEILIRLKKQRYDGWLFFEFNKDNSVEQLAEDIRLMKSLMA
jgi:3-dehydroshikimate dehydratase